MMASTKLIHEFPCLSFIADGRAVRLVAVPVDTSRRVASESWKEPGESLALRVYLLRISPESRQPQGQGPSAHPSPR
jgi:hypothetical protein